MLFALEMEEENNRSAECILDGREATGDMGNVAAGSHDLFQKTME